MHSGPLLERCSSPVEITGNSRIHSNRGDVHGGLDIGQKAAPGDRFVRDLSGPRPVAVAHQEFQLARGWLEVLVVVELPGRGEVA